MASARGRVGSHRPGDRGAAAQRIVDEAADGVAVAGAGEAMGFAPVCERDRHRLVPGHDRFENFDGSRDARAGLHWLIPP